jgi:hypothetical protein
METTHINSYELITRVLALRLSSSSSEEGSVASAGPDLAVLFWNPEGVTVMARRLSCFCVAAGRRLAHCHSQSPCP